MVDLVTTNSLIVTSAFLVIPFLLFFPVEKLISKLLGSQVPKTFFLFAFPALLVFVASLQLWFPTGIAMFFISIFNTWAFLFAFNSNRKYIYILAFILLGLIPLLLILKLDKIAEYFAILFYLALVMGLTKDAFYEKFFKE
mgnify:CR=1 FL=1